MKIFKNAFWAVLAISVGSVFASCSKDSETTPSPTIKIDQAQNTQVQVGGSLLITGEINSSANLETVVFEYVKKSGGTAEFKRVSSFNPKTYYQIRETISELTEDITGVKIIATDKDGRPSTEILNIKVGNTTTTTPLSAEAAFTITYTGAAPVTSNGITYKNNSNATTAAFTATGNFVMLDQTKYTAITTKEALSAAFASGTKEAGFSVQSNDKFAPVYLIAKDGEILRLVKMTNLKFAAGNNVASFTQKN